MVREPRVFLRDARKTADAVLEFTRGRTFEDDGADFMLRSAVERQLEIVGEALAQLSRIDAALAARVPDFRRIVAFRNILVHGYAAVKNDEVWPSFRAICPSSGMC